MDIEDAHALDLYTTTPAPEVVSESFQQQLTSKARNLHQLLQAHARQQFFATQQYYLLSSKWLARWKLYVGYDQINAGKQLNKFFGSGALPIINEDIVDQNWKPDVKFPEVGDHKHYNISLKTGLQEGRDYVFFTKQMWQIISQKPVPDKDNDRANSAAGGFEFQEYYNQTYPNYEILRKVVETPEGKKVQLHYLKVTVVPTSNQILKEVQYQKRLTLLSYTFQVSHYLTVEEFNSLTKKIIKRALPSDYSSSFQKQLPVKLWLAPQKTDKVLLYNSFLQGCKANSTFSYKLYFEGMKLDDEKLLSEYDILDDSLLMMEFKENREDWCFFNRENLLVSTCAQCRKVDKLQYLCSCKFAAYCSRSCQLKDRTYHEGRCPTNAESEEEETELVESNESKKGVVGLRNLGNTCFMNSGLQCLSHIFQLTEYFLKNKYIKDINKDNPLGTKGQLSVAYAKMLKNLWHGVQPTFSPTNVKRAIGKFQPMFTGYNQHDSGQLITYMLDGLHEDLNRIKIKPYVQSKDYDGRPDQIIAKQQWSNFLKRNQSEIVDLMYGQYRSVVDCPKCNNRSIQFDPFCMCSLPIINNAVKKIELVYLDRHIRTHKLQICFEKSWNWSMNDVLDDIKKKLGKPTARLITYVATYASCQIIDSSRLANEVRSEYKYRTIYVRQLEDEENPDQDIRIYLGNTICHTYYKDQSYRKSLTQYRLYYFNKNLTLKELHHKIHGYYAEISSITDYETQVIAQEKSEQPLRLLAIATTKYSPCEYCHKKHCEGCVIPYDDSITLDKFVEKVQEDRIQFQLFWRKNGKAVQKKFDELSEEKGQDDAIGLSKGDTTLSDCFRLFSEPETLAEDNAWYCPNCKDFVLAKKQMQIYKAPQILALCLKRFKRKEYFQQKYNILIDFPINNLDISEFVLHPQIPSEHVQENQQTQIQVQKEGPLLYDLFAISNHFGGTGGGHYTAYCKNPITGQWYDFDDSYVREITKKNQLVTQSAYILFYRRKK